MKDDQTEAEMIQIIFDKLTKYLDEEFSKINNYLDGLTYKCSNLQSTVDSYTKQLAIYRKGKVSKCRSK